MSRTSISTQTSFDVVSNTTKAVAYAYDLKKKDGSPILKMTNVTSDFSNDSKLIDVRINGELQNPSLTNSKHTAALLASAILVAEQMIIEQLLRDAVKQGENHPNVIALKTIINDDNAYLSMIKIASELLANDLGPIMGLQFGYCASLIELVRKTLGHQALSALAEQLFEANAYNSALLNNKMLAKLDNLMKIGDILQSLNGISAKEQQSRGINAGLTLVAQKLASIKNHTNAKSWCSYFTAAIVPLAVVGAVYAADQYVRNTMK